MLTIETKEIFYCYLHRPGVLDPETMPIPRNNDYFGIFILFLFYYYYFITTTTTTTTTTATATATATTTTITTTNTNTIIIWR